MAPPDDPLPTDVHVDPTDVEDTTPATAPADISTSAEASRPALRRRDARPRSHDPDTAATAVPTIEPLAGSYVSVLKPALDRVAAAVLLIVLSPVLLIGMLAVRIALGPGVFFVQQRVGRGGEIFSTYKLRTMAHDRRETSEGDIQAFRDGRWDGIERRNTHKSAQDPRLNRTGRLLRTFSVDEIPQLVNILRGDMSLVGPRPELPGVVDALYQPWMHRRHAVRPGLTGLWQVSERGNGMMHEHVDVDLEYVDSVSLATDLQIILRTPYAALGPRRGF